MNRSSDSLEQLALRKQLLLARSALYRLRIRHELNTVRGMLTPARMGIEVAKTVPVRAALIGLALAAIPRDRLARFLVFATRALFVARLTGIAVQLLRKPSAPPTV
jgi:hypothetical protein